MTPRGATLALLGFNYSILGEDDDAGFGHVEELLVAFQDLSVSDTGIPVEVTWSLDMSPNDNVSRKILYRPEDGKWMQEQAKRLLDKHKAWSADILAKTVTDYRNTKKGRKAAERQPFFLEMPPGNIPP